MTAAPPRTTDNMLPLVCRPPCPAPPPDQDAAGQNHSAGNAPALCEYQARCPPPVVRFRAGFQQTERALHGANPPAKPNPPSHRRCPFQQQVLPSGQIGLMGCESCESCESARPDSRNSRNSQPVYPLARTVAPSAYSCQTHQPALRLLGASSRTPRIMSSVSGSIGASQPRPARVLIASIAFSAVLIEFGPRRTMMALYSSVIPWCLHHSSSCSARLISGGMLLCPITRCASSRCHDA